MAGVTFPARCLSRISRLNSAQLKRLEEHQIVRCRDPREFHAFCAGPYQLYFAPEFGRGDFVEFSTSLNLPEGSYVIGYGLNPPKNGTQAVQATPFTFAGRVSVPEPATLTLLIPALGLFGLARRKFVV
jgi:hypothetical protein